MERLITGLKDLILRIGWTGGLVEIFESYCFLIYQSFPEPYYCQETDNQDKNSDVEQI